MEQVFVVKRSGAKESFSEEKVIHSMRRVGLPQALHPMVLMHIKENLHPGITTNEIFSHVLEFVKEKDKKATIRLNLKQSLFELGPTGFPFEQYMARVFTNMGFKPSTNVVMRGECITHEVDLVIEKDGKRAIVEAKFHNQPGNKTDVQVALYTHARFMDVAGKNDINGVWIVTNTRLTLDAITYAQCKNIQIIGWNYPSKGNLQDLIEEPALYPVTILTALTSEDKRRLMEEKVVLCQDLLKMDDQALRNIMLSPEKLANAKGDAQLVCKINSV